MDERRANRGSIVDVPGVTVGHAHDLAARTGCTVVLTEQGAVCGVDVRGSAPGTRETDVLAPTAHLEAVHAIVLCGGSAFGLDAAGGVMRALAERGVGYAVGPYRVPIVPAAVIFDLFVGDGRVRPDAVMGAVAARGFTRGAGRGTGRPRCRRARRRRDCRRQRGRLDPRCADARTDRAAAR